VQRSWLQLVFFLKEISLFHNCDLKYNKQVSKSISLEGGWAPREAMNPAVVFDLQKKENSLLRKDLGLRKTLHCPVLAEMLTIHL